MTYSLLVLLVSFSLNIFFTLIYRPLLWNDEMILFTVSKQPIQELFSIIIAERHPPLYYFLARILPDSHSLIARVILLTISYGLLFVLLKFLEKKKFEGKRVFDLGLAFFLTSTTFLALSSDLKRHAIAFPLFVFTIGLTLLIISKEKLIKQFIFLNILLLLLFLTDYLSYFWAIAVFSFIMLQYKKRELILQTAIVQSIGVVIYFLFLGHAQLIYNASHVSWVSEFANAWSNHPLSALLQHLGGGVVIPSVCIFFILLFFVLVAIKNLGKSHKKFVFQAIIFFIAMASVAYASHLYIRPRYSFLVFFLLSIAAAKGILFLRLSTIKIALVLGSAFIVGFVGFVDHKIWLNKFHSRLAMMVLIQAETQKVALLTNGQNVFPQVFWRYYTLDSRIVPINAATMLPFAYSDALTIQEIAAIKKGDAIDTLRKVIADQSLHSILYVSIDYPNQHKDEVIEVILQVCGITQEQEIVQGVKLKRFSCM